MIAYEELTGEWYIKKINKTIRKIFSIRGGELKYTDFKIMVEVKTANYDNVCLGDINPERKIYREATEADLVKLNIKIY